MTINADLIDQWRAAHPGERLNTPVLLDIDRHAAARAEVAS